MESALTNYYKLKQKYDNKLQKEKESNLPKEFVKNSSKKP